MRSSTARPNRTKRWRSSSDQLLKQIDGLHILVGRRPHGFGGQNMGWSFS